MHSLWTVQPLRAPAAPAPISRTRHVNRKIREARILKRAREIAATGKHIGWYYVEAELRFQMGEPLARQVLSDQQIREELDRICTEARKLRRQCGALQP